MTRSTVRPTMPFFLVTPKLVRSRRAVAPNLTAPSSARTAVTRTSAGAGVPSRSPAGRHPAVTVTASAPADEGDLGEAPGVEQAGWTTVGVPGGVA